MNLPGSVDGVAHHENTGVGSRDGLGCMGRDVPHDLLFRGVDEGQCFCGGQACPGRGIVQVRIFIERRGPPLGTPGAGGAEVHYRSSGQPQDLAGIQRTGCFKRGGEGLRQVRLVDHDHGVGAHQSRIDRTSPGADAVATEEQAASHLVHGAGDDRGQVGKRQPRGIPGRSTTHLDHGKHRAIG